MYQNQPGSMTAVSDSSYLSSWYINQVNDTSGARQWVRSLVTIGTSSGASNGARRGASSGATVELGVKLAGELAGELAVELLRG